MSTPKVYYSINVTVPPSLYSLYILSVAPTLAKIQESLSALSDVRAAFFLDSMFLENVRTANPSEYADILSVLKSIQAQGHSLETLVSTTWENTEDIHRIHNDKVLDYFAYGKNLITDIMGIPRAKSNFTNKQKRVPERSKKVAGAMQDDVPPVDTGLMSGIMETGTDSSGALIEKKGRPTLPLSKIENSGSVVRLIESKLQPFYNLKEAYNLARIRIDCSVLPNLVEKHVYDYSKIRRSAMYRFTNDPNRPERFGEFYALPRTIVKLSKFKLYRFRKRVRGFSQKNKGMCMSYLSGEEYTTPFLNAPKQQKHFVFSPDSIDQRTFYDLVQSQERQDVLSIESTFSHVSPMTFLNLNELLKANYSFITSADLLAHALSHTNKGMLAKK